MVGTDHMVKRQISSGLSGAAIDCNSRQLCTDVDCWRASSRDSNGARVFGLVGMSRSFIPRKF